MRKISNSSRFWEGHDFSRAATGENASALHRLRWLIPAVTSSPQHSEHCSSQTRNLTSYFFSCSISLFSRENRRTMAPR